MKSPRARPSDPLPEVAQPRERSVPLGARESVGGMISTGSTTRTSGAAGTGASGRRRPRPKRQGITVLLTIMPIKIDNKILKHNTLLLLVY